MQKNMRKFTSAKTLKKNEKRLTGWDLGGTWTVLGGYLDGTWRVLGCMARRRARGLPRVRESSSRRRAAELWMRWVQCTCVQHAGDLAEQGAADRFAHYAGPNRLTSSTTSMFRQLPRLRRQVRRLLEDLVGTAGNGRRDCQKSNRVFAFNFSS